MRLFFHPLMLVFGMTLLMLTATLTVQRQKPATSSPYIAFVSYRTGQPDVYRMLADGSQVRQLTDTFAPENLPVWSPHLPVLAFTVLDMDTTLSLIHANGSLTVPIIRGVTADTVPRWSPNGSWLLFAANDGRDSEIFRIRADGTQLQQLTDNTYPDVAPAWSPDGKWIAYRSAQSTHEDLWRLNADGTDPRHLSSMAAFTTYPVWSPDSQWLCFVTYNYTDSNTEIYRVNANGYQLQNLTQHPAVDADPAWSRDGKWIYFVSNRGGDWNIFRMRSDGTEVERLTASGSDGWPIPSPDGKWIAFISNRTGDNEIYKMRADGSDEQRLTYSAGVDIQPSWSAPVEVAWQAQRGLILGLCLLMLFLIILYWNIIHL